MKALNTVKKAPPKQTGHGGRKPVYDFGKLMPGVSQFYEAGDDEHVKIMNAAHKWAARNKWKVTVVRHEDGTTEVHRRQ